jgi:hypothetical protein
VFRSQDQFGVRYGKHRLPKHSSTGTHFTFSQSGEITLADYHREVERQHFIIYDHAETSPILNAIRHDYTLPSILQFASLETILSLGGSPQGATFQQHQVAWLATVFGKKHWYMAHPNTPKPPEPYCPTHSGDARTEKEWGSHGVVYCDVHPGEIIWVPDQWWHATCNGALYTVAIGGQQFVPHESRQA